MTVKLFHVKANKAFTDAKNYFEANNINYVVQNIKYDKIEWNDFLRMVELAEDGVETLFPTEKSTEAMKILNKVDMDSITLRELYEMIVENPILIRTPLMLSDKNFMVGLSREEISMFDNRKDKKSRFNQLLESVRMNERYQLEEEVGHLLV